MIDAVNGSAAGEVLDALLVADDLTGAADTAVAFAAAGLPTPGEQEGSAHAFGNDASPGHTE